MFVMASTAIVVRVGLLYGVLLVLSGVFMMRVQNPPPGLTLDSS
jgi:hypothetical protein